MINKGFKTAGLIFLISAVIITFSACDMLGDEESFKAETEKYEIDLMVYTGDGLTGDGEAAEDFASELEVFVEDGTVGEFEYREDDGSVVATVEISGEGSKVRVEHPAEDLSEPFMRSESYLEDMVVAHGTLEVKSELDTVSLPEHSTLFRLASEELEAETRLGGLALKDSSGKFYSISTGSDPLYGAFAGEGKVEMAVFDKGGTVIAEGDVALDGSGDALELELISSGPALEIDGVKQQASAQERGGYLAEYTIDADEDPKDEPFQVGLEIIEGKKPLEDGDRFIIIGDTAMDLDEYVFGGEDEFDEFLETYEIKTAAAGDSVLYMYDVDDSMTRITAEEEETLDGEEWDEIRSEVITVYDEDGEIIPRGSAMIEYSREEIEIEDETIYEYEVTLSEVNGLPYAERFTIRDLQGSSTDYADIGGTVRRNAQEKDHEDKMEVYILGDAAEEPEGNGEEDNPYKIETAYQLVNWLYRGEFYEDAHFQLAASIDMQDLEEVNEEWRPVGSASRPFQGELDGNGYEIKNLEIDPTARTDVGLFGYLGEDAEVKDLHLLNVNVSGDTHVGALAGRSKGTIEDVRFHGDLSVDGDYRYVGGLVGRNLEDGKIENARIPVEGNVSAGGSFVGGLVGANEGEIKDSFSYLDVGGDSDAVGGLVGWNAYYDDGANLTDSYAAGNVSGDGEVGGLVGVNEGRIEDSYALGDVAGEGDRVGGLVGSNEGDPEENNNDKGVVHDSYAEGDVNGLNDVGGLVGINEFGHVHGSDLDDPDESAKYTNYAKGDVSAEQSNAGGIAGRNRDDKDVSSIKKVWASGSISVEEMRAGGIVGRNDSTLEDAKYSANSGVFGPEYVGLVIGQNYAPENAVVMDTIQGEGELPEDADEVETIGGLIGNQVLYEFLVGDISIDPGSFDQGAKIDIEANIENDGYEPGTQDITLEIDWESDRKTKTEDIKRDIEINDDEKRDVTFEEIKVPGDAGTEGGDIEITVSTDDDEKTEDTKAQAAAYYLIDDIDTPDSAVRGEEIEVTVGIENIGATSESQDIEASIDWGEPGVDEWTEEVDVDSENTDDEAAEFTIPVDPDADPGTTEVKVESKNDSDTAEFEVEEAGNADNVELEADPETIGIDAETTLTAIVTDKFDNLVEGVDVEFSGGDGSWNETTVETGDQGEATATYTSDADDYSEITLTAEEQEGDNEDTVEITVEPNVHDESGLEGALANDDISTINVANDIELSSTLNIIADREVTLDLGGNALQEHAIKLGSVHDDFGDITIQNGSIEPVDDNLEGNQNIIRVVGDGDSGSLTLEDVTVNYHDDYSGIVYGLLVSSDADLDELTVENSEFNLSDDGASEDRFGVRVNYADELTLTDTVFNIESESYARGFNPADDDVGEGGITVEGNDFSGIDSEEDPRALAYATDQVVDTNFNLAENAEYLLENNAFSNEYQNYHDSGDLRSETRIAFRYGEVEDWQDDAEISEVTEEAQGEVTMELDLDTGDTGHFEGLDEEYYFELLDDDNEEVVQADSISDEGDGVYEATWIGLEEDSELSVSVRVLDAEIGDETIDTE